MANHSSASSYSELQEIKKLLWGPYVKEDVFRRWAQGFHCSKDEPTALVQSEGGPCAVLAPVQAFILKSLLSESVGNNWREADADKCNELLVQAACDILTQASENNGGRYVVVHMNNDLRSHTSPNSVLTNGEEPIENPSTELIETSAKRQKLEYEHFHTQLRLLPLERVEEVEAFYFERIETLRETFGVLLLLYSVISTKGVEQIRSEMNDPTEPLIDGTYGYGSQSLINLMLTGRAVGHIWNHDQDVGGLKLRGINCQSEVGFLALLEHLRYCEVGSFLKNPKHPVWVMGSETHLTVLFSLERRLVSPETPSEVARRVFKSFDPEGNNFISAVLLQDVLRALELVSEAEYVEIMTRKLDAENLGIILLNAFMEEFFPEEKQSTPDTFTLFHYNGQPRSCPDGRVVYQEGNAVLLECDMKCVLESNPMLTCLQTKWPNIEVQWLSGVTPSLN
ncbi:Ubiquitin carboxyl-terminal hydrolase MINDY-3-like protein [Cryptotermes secundus]|uniref:Ubiquitin carboxyl-terminal hydrolase MINDY n=1 Tax=Cryptotermes secundus TaxID=105785 RepID=A0A2J7QUX6_9NEOP|nr:ubiquitin carboxyl-terminal hydrolase MINDY-3 homolog isoform X2 [Cryptotermes secundus]PNF32390.1 Ubiquitin carboxyl-terminal hydrolase MINDY-3-like protein [Cryptotermes secundus]PNF32391.1 Ubiquitin carboxyl-terminal hydrolase MINDY-3-like protein [Cryptotermes secundus]